MSRTGCRYCLTIVIAVIRVDSLFVMNTFRSLASRAIDTNANDAAHITLSYFILFWQRVRQESEKEAATNYYLTGQNYEATASTWKPSSYKTDLPSSFAPTSFPSSSVHPPSKPSFSALTGSSALSSLAPTYADNDTITEARQLLQQWASNVDVTPVFHIPDDAPTLDDDDNAECELLNQNKDSTIISQSTIECCVRPLLS